jgi:hypothetical protein
MIRKIVLAVCAIGASIALSACEPAADVASRNLSKAADNFEVNRRISVFATTMQGVENLMTIQGKCSLGNNDPVNELTVTCKDGPGEFKKHFIGLSSNVSYIVEQGNAVSVSEFHTRIVFRPQAILPDPDFIGSTDELLNNKNTDG